MRKNERPVWWHGTFTLTLGANIARIPLPVLGHCERQTRVNLGPLFLRLLWPGRTGSAHWNALSQWSSVDKAHPPKYYFPIIAVERKRRVGRLLNEIEPEAGQQNRQGRLDLHAPS